VLERAYKSMRHWYRLLGQGSEGARALELDGVLAVLVPAVPERSYMNAVLYEEPAALAAAYEEIAAAYAEIGAAWTVWVRHGDRDSPALLAARGHVLDASPAAMARALGDIERPADGALADWTANGSLADVGAINDRAYRFGTDSFSRALTRLPAGAAHIYVAREGGEPVACAMLLDHEGNTELDAVAVVPEARGRGLSGVLIAHGLADAAERGVQTTTLVATALGRPVYDRLGYRPLGTLQMWERRAEPERS
jgi:N-acetylglutamate synthase-like GNAT family acetyltransferase